MVPGRQQYRLLAERIATRLFMNGMGQRAIRLQLRLLPDERDGGGWCFQAVVDVIMEELEQTAWTKRSR